MLNSQTYVLRQFDETYLRSMQHQLIEMNRVLSALCIKDRPPVTSRPHDIYQMMSAYNKIRVNALMNNIQCDASCTSFAHEEVKKLLFLEEIFNSWNLSIVSFAGDISILRKYDALCDSFVQKNPEKNYASYKLYELDAIEKHEHKDEIIEFANDLKKFAILEQFDIKYNDHRPKTLEAQKKFEQNPAHPIIRSRRTENGILDIYLLSNCQFPAHVQIRQLLHFASTFPNILSYDTLANLKNLEKFYSIRQRGINNIQKNENRYNPFLGQKVERQFVWAKQVVDKVNIEFSKIRGLQSGDARPELPADETLLKDLELIADSNDKHIGFDIICEAKSLVMEYERWIASVRREKS